MAQERGTVHAVSQPDARYPIWLHTLSVQAWQKTLGVYVELGACTRALLCPTVAGNTCSVLVTARCRHMLPSCTNTMRVGIATA